MSTINTIRRGGLRFYVRTDDGRRAVGVTSVISMAPKPFLTHWAARVSAEYAVTHIDTVATLARTDPGAAVDLIKGAHRRYTAGRAELGSAAHDLFERMIRGEHVGRVAMDLEPYRRHFAEFLDTVQPELISAEDVMWSDTYGYAGSSDAILRIQDAEHGSTVVIVDWKTSRDTYPDVALQLAAYAHADVIVTPDGEESPMPEIQAGAVLHVTPERWALKPVRIDDEVFQIFLTLRRVVDWDRELSRQVIGKAIVSGGAVETGTQRRAR